MTTVHILKDHVSLRVDPKGLLWLMCLGLLMLLLAVVSLLMGSFDLELATIWHTLLEPKQNSEHAVIIWEFRLPRTAVALLAGTLFALSGALLQALTRNPLADPSLVGISQGAALAVVAMTVLFPDTHNSWREIGALVGSLTVALIIRVVAGSGASLKFILVGIGLAAFVSALTSSMLTYGDLEQAMSALAWLAGSVNTASWMDVRLLALSNLLFFVLILTQARSLSPLRFSAETAVGLGVNHKLVNSMLLLTSVLAAAMATAVVGPMAFVGLLAPHLSRFIVKTGPLQSLIITAFIGASLVLTADLLGRTLFAPTQLPAGLLTSLLGAPVLLVLLLKKSKAAS